MTDDAKIVCNVCAKTYPADMAGWTFCMGGPVEYICKKCSPMDTSEDVEKAVAVFRTFIKGDAK